MVKLKTIFKENWKAIIFSYSLFSINSILMLVYPKVLGNTIDHLMDKDYGYIWYMVGNFVLMMFFGYISRIYDIKVFSGIYRKFASDETYKQIESGVETTKINGRLTLMNNIVKFFEFDMIIVIQTFLGVIVSIYFLSLVSLPIVFFLILSGLAIVGASYYYSPKLAAMTALNNDISEEQTEIIATRKIGGINNLLRRGQKIAIKRAYIDSKFGLWIQAIVYGSVTALLTYYVMYNKVTIGSVFSTYRYMFDFCNALLGLPTILTSYINIKDVVKRLETEN
jgi:ABC-type bacteriocin/lantibiotic exporter with double-glycine peptidase domain